MKIINKTNLSLKLSVFILTLVCVIFTACSKMDGTYKEFIEGGEIRYSQKPDTIGVSPGHNRVKAWLAVSSANVSKFKVYWNNRADSIEVPVIKTLNVDTVSVMIENLAEGSYVFEFLTYDSEGNSSIAIDTVGEVFGDLYVNSLSNRLIENSGLINGNVMIAWYAAANAQVIGTEISYKDQNEDEHSIVVKLEDNITRIVGRPFGNTIKYRTIFIPHPHSIDTFYTEFETLVLEDAVPVELDKSKFVELKLPTDASKSKYSDGMHHLWDGTSTNQTFYSTNNDSGRPHWFTFDMGITAGLNELVYYQRALDAPHLLFTNANAKVWEVWGSNDPNPDGSWDESWVKLMSCESERPSGLKFGEESTEADLAQIRDGERFAFPQDTPPVRYIRIKVLGTWNPSLNDRAFFGEITLFGVAE